MQSLRITKFFIVYLNLTVIDRGVNGIDFYFVLHNPPVTVTSDSFINRTKKD